MHYSTVNRLLKKILFLLLFYTTVIRNSIISLKKISCHHHRRFFRRTWYPEKKLVKKWKHTKGQLIAAPGPNAAIKVYICDPRAPFWPQIYTFERINIYDFVNKDKLLNQQTRFTSSLLLLNSSHFWF